MQLAAQNLNDDFSQRVVSYAAGAEWSPSPLPGVERRMLDRVGGEALGSKVRKLFASRGLPSVAAERFKAPGVVVSYTTDTDIQTGRNFLDQGLQTAADVPLQCDEGADFMTFRVGLFGLDKWHHIDKTVAHLAEALDRLGLIERVAEEMAH